MINLIRVTAEPSAQYIKDWLIKESLTLTHVGKVILASVLALWFSFLMDLEQPRTAVITVAIVMQTHSGMVLSKSYYRLIGSVVGILVSFLLVALFAQEPMLFLFGMALWIGICTAGSLILRDHQSYAFVLAGYTLCIVGLPATVNTDLSFTLAMNRVSEITVGLLCATVVSDVVFPRRMGDAILLAIRQRFKDFTALMIPNAVSQSNKASLMNIMNDVFRVESYQASSTLESDASRTLRLKLTQLNREFMNLATTHHAITEHIRRIKEKGEGHQAHQLESLYQTTGLAVRVTGGEVPVNLDSNPILQQLQQLETHLTDISNLNRVNHPDKNTELQTGILLLQRLLSELMVYIKTYANLDTSTSLKDIPSTGIHFEPVAVLLAGLRGALVLMFTALFWILSAWPSGIEAITMAVVAATLFASSPNPSKTVSQFLTGGLIGAVLGYWVNFNLLVQAQDFLTLIIAILPGIIVASVLTAKPNTAVVGGGIFIVYLSHLGFGKTYQDNHVLFFNDVIADFVGLLCSAVMYQLMDLQSNSWLQQRVVRSLRQLVVNCCQTQEPLQREKFELAVRELIYRSGSTHKTVSKEDQQLLIWFFICLETGHIVINIQQSLNELSDHQTVSSINNTLDSIAQLFTRITHHHFNQSIELIDQSIHQLNQHLHGRESFIKADLQLLKYTLIDHQSWLTHSKVEER
ncbi:MAG: FUSC family protein [Betaproteobacteria bacterium]|nr:FUSC family protein [Betaproteobacteria bacterium]